MTTWHVIERKPRNAATWILPQAYATAQAAQIARNALQQVHNLLGTGRKFSVASCDGRDACSPAK